MRKLYLGIFIWGLVACVPTQEIISETPTSVILPTATSTQVWFPPTIEPTLIPTVELVSTEIFLPSLGEIIFIDDFTNANFWSEELGDGSNITVVDGAINFVLSHPFDYLFSYRSQPILDNFYLEITANPNICVGNSEYGVLIRASTDPSYYRFAINCNGEASISLILPGSAQLVVPWGQNPFLPHVTPGNVRLGIWANGREIWFYAEDIFLFSIENAQLFEGSVGLFTRTIEGDAISIQFKEMNIYGLD